MGIENLNVLQDQEKDLTSADMAVDLMSGSKSEQEWNDNCDKIKAANGGYPDWWYEKILASGLASKTQMSWER